MLTCVWLIYLCLPDSNAVSGCDPDIPSRPGTRAAEMLGESGIVQVKCGAGTYYNTHLHQCDACLNGYFMTEDMANKKVPDCLRCSTPRQNEKIKVACTPTRDTEIMCAPGFYKVREASNHCAFSCEACSICGLGEQFYKNYEARSCLEANDTICCYDDNMDENCVYKTTTTTTTTTTTITTTLIPQLARVKISAKFEHQVSYNSACSFNTVNKTQFLLLFTVSIASIVMYIHIICSYIFTIIIHVYTSLVQRAQNYQLLCLFVSSNTPLY